MGMNQDEIRRLKTSTIASAKLLSVRQSDVVFIAETRKWYNFTSSNSGDIILNGSGSLNVSDDGLVVSATTDVELTKQEIDAYKYVMVLAVPADTNDITISNETGTRGNAVIDVLYDGTDATLGNVIVNLATFQSGGVQTLTGPGQFCSHRRTNSLGNANFWSLIQRDTIKISSDIATNTSAISSLDGRVTALENEPDPTLITNGNALVKTEATGEVVSIAQAQYGHLRSNGTDTWTENIGAFARSDGPTDNGTGFPLNQFLSPGQLPVLNPTSPPEAIGESTIECTSINGIQGRSNIYYTNNVYQSLLGGGEFIEWTIAGIRPGATIYGKIRAANNQGAGSFRSGSIQIIHDGITTTQNYSAPADIGTTNGQEFSVQYTVPESSSESQGSFRFNVDAGQIGVVVSFIEIDVEQYWGNSITQNSGVMHDRQNNQLASYLDQPFNGDLSSVPDNAVLATNENGVNTYRKKVTLGGNDSLLSSGDKIVQRFSIIAGANWYRLATAQSTAKFIRSLKGFSTDGSHSENYELEIGVRARIQGVGGGISNNQYVPRMKYSQLGAFSFFGSTTSDSVVRAFRFVQDGDSTDNRTIHVDVQYWQDSSTSVIENHWDLPLSSDQDNLVVNHDSDILVNPDIVGFTINEFQLRQYTYRNGNAYGVEFVLGSTDEQWRTNTDGNLVITAPFIGT